MRQSHHIGALYLGLLIDRDLHFPRRHIGAAGFDQVAQAGLEEQEAVLIQVAAVAAVVEAVRVEAVLPFDLVQSLHHIVAANTHFAIVARRQARAAVGIDDLVLDTLQRPPEGAAHVFRQVDIHAVNGMRPAGLGHAQGVGAQLGISGADAWAAAGDRYCRREWRTGRAARDWDDWPAPCRSAASR